MFNVYVITHTKSLPNINSVIITVSSQLYNVLLLLLLLLPILCEESPVFDMTDCFVATSYPIQLR